MEKEPIKVRTRMEAMLELQSLTQDTLVLHEIALENSKRTVVELQKNRVLIYAKLNSIKLEREKKKYQSTVASPFDAELARNISDGIKKQMEIDSAKVSLGILEKMIEEENDPELKKKRMEEFEADKENLKKEEEGATEEKK